MTMRSLKYLSVAMLFAVSSCTYNQYTMTGGGDDDLYGGRYDEAVVVAGNRSALPSDYNTNPDYQGGSESAEATDQYYDENYITARNIQRNVSNEVGYKAGFTDGYFAGRNAGFNNSFYGGMFPTWGYPGFNIGFRMGMGSMIGLGYSPFGWSRWNRWGSFYDPYWDAMAWGDPFMYGGYGNPYYGGFGYPYYGGLGYGMYGYNPYRWSNYYPVIINNNYGESGVRTRNYGPRTSGSAVSRTASSGSRREPGTTPVARSGARTSNSRGNVAPSEGYYTRPRSAVSGSTRDAAGNSSSRVSGGRGANASGNYYYANPNTNRSSIGGSSNARTRSISESGRSSSSGYYNSAPSRSSNSYSAPSRSYSAPSSTPSRSYSTPSTPSRSYSAPSSTPSRSYSAPSSSGGGSRSSTGGGGRGPR
jgi:hypothetical protein